MSETLEDPTELPLAGYTVAVTAARRKEELGALLDRRGARVVYAPAIRIVPLADDTELVAATREVLAQPVDLVIATTGVGFRGWLEAADAWDLPLVEHLRSARVLARGPKARGAIRGGGLVDAWSPESESSAEVLSHLLSGAEGPLAGRRIAVQLHGDPLPDLVTGLRATRRRGADRAGLPLGAARGRRPGAAAGRVVVAGDIDAVTFTSAPAAASLLAVARRTGPATSWSRRCSDRVLVVAVGPVTAGPLDAVGVPTFQPERARLGALAREVVARLPERDPVLTVGEHTLQVRGYAVVLDGRLVELRARAHGGAAGTGPPSRPRRPPHRPDRLAARWRRRARRRDGGDPAARGAGRPVVETVVKRGYRLKLSEWIVQRSCIAAGEQCRRREACVVRTRRQPARSGRRPSADRRSSGWTGVTSLAAGPASTAGGAEADGPCVGEPLQRRRRRPLAEPPCAAASRRAVPATARPSRRNAPAVDRTGAVSACGGCRRSASLDRPRRGDAGRECPAGRPAAVTASGEPARGGRWCSSDGMARRAQDPATRRSSPRASRGWRDQRSPATSRGPDASSRSSRLRRRPDRRHRARSTGRPGAGDRTRWAARERTAMRHAGMRSHRASADAFRRRPIRACGRR